MWTIYSRIAVFLHFPREIVREMRNVKSGGREQLGMRNENGSRAGRRCSALTRRRPMRSSGDGERVDGRLAALTRRCVGAPLYDCKSCAGEMLRLAGCSSGRGPPCAREPAAGRGWENPSGFAQPPPLSGEAIRALDGARASHEKGEVSPQATEGLSPCRGVYVARKKHSAA